MKQNPHQRSRWLPVLALLLLQFALAGAVRADWVNVKTWNPGNPTLEAAGNGVVNDAPAVQAAINSMTNGGTLYFPAGRYLIAGKVGTNTDYPLSNHALFITNGLTIEGDGMDATTLIQGNYQVTMIGVCFTGPVAGFTIENIHLLADETSTNGFIPTGSGVLLGCQGAGKLGAWSKGFRMDNVATDDQSKNHAVYLLYADDVHIEQCRFDSFANSNNLANAGTGCAAIMFGGQGAYAGAVFVNDNTFNGNCTAPPNTGIGDDGLTYVQGADSAVITGNYLKNARLEAIASGANHQTITGNIYSDPDNDSILVRASCCNNSWNTNYQMVVAENTQLGGASFFDDTGSQMGISLDYVIADNTVQIGNKAAGVGGAGAMTVGYYSNACRVLVEGNSFDNYGGYGLALEDSTGNYATAALIEGNSMTSMASGHLGIGIGGSTNSCFQNIAILGNTLSGGSDGSMDLHGPSTGTNVLAQLLMADNLCLNQTNQSTTWIRVQDPLNTVQFEWFDSILGNGVEGVTDAAGFDINYSLLH